MMIKKIYKSVKNGDFLDKLDHKIFLSPFYKIYNLVSPFCKVDNNKIVFCSGGDSYGGDPKYVAEYIINNHLNYKLIWLVDKSKFPDDSCFPKEIKVVKLFTFESMYEYSTAKVWIDNSRKIYYPRKKKNQIYIQTWHGNFPFKKVEKDATLPETYIKIAKKDAKITDYMLSGNRAATEVYKHSFWFEGKVLEVGTPNCDIFFSDIKINENSQKVKAYYNIEDRVHILLYAPTFRNNNDLSVYNIDYGLLYKTLKNKFGGEWIILSRLHLNVYNNFDNYSLPSDVINATYYPDMIELQCAADIAITDVSGWIFQYCLLKRPIFYFMTDADNYFKNDRSLYYMPSDTPFPFAKTNKELCDNIMRFNKDSYLEELTRFMKHYSFCLEGKSCENVIKIINNETSY